MSTTGTNILKRQVQRRSALQTTTTTMTIRHSSLLLYRHFSEDGGGASAGRFGDSKLSSSSSSSVARRRYKSFSTQYDSWSDYSNSWKQRQRAPKTISKKSTPLDDTEDGLSYQKPPRYACLIDIPGTATMQYSNSNSTGAANFELYLEDFTISKPKQGNGGGHVLLGKSGSGKSLLVNYLSRPEAYFQDNNTDDDPPLLLKSSQISYVSFDSHLKILEEHPDRTVHNVITGGIGNLSKAAQYLVVRFGLFPLLTRTVSTLSTGEIRKCLLVSALCQDPELLILENAFDGLDVNSRKELQSIVSKTIQGLDKSGKLLIQSVHAGNVRPAQVLMSTHRPEEIVDEISTISMTTTTAADSMDKKQQKLVTLQRPKDSTKEQLMYMALGLSGDGEEKDDRSEPNWSTVEPWDEPDSTTASSTSLPSLEEIHAVWTQGQEEPTPETLIELDHVQVQRYRDGDFAAENENDAKKDEYVTLLHDMSWKIQKGQRWLIAGGNGAGKSTLTRFLLQDEEGAEDQDSTNVREEPENKDDYVHDLISGRYYKDSATKIGWISTESHLGMVVEQSSLNGTADRKTMWEVITHDGTVSSTIAETIAQWIFGDAAVVQDMKDRPLHELSQGEQKLALMTASLALRPNVLILDEPTTGLDWIARRRVLALMERLCQATPDDLSLIFITHYPEELVPSISHVLHLDHGHAVYQGPKSQYDPSKIIANRNEKQKN
eukprot:scaffold1051_cov119-Cylindrotheca_fusiformis.AAC.29